MKKKFLIFFALIVVIVMAGLGIRWFTGGAIIDQSIDKTMNTKETANLDTGEERDMVVAGGCFWCVESDLEKVPGVQEVISGYSGGDLENPTYENYSKGGHREVARVVYNPSQVSYRQLLLYFIKHIDPTDGDGSFGDRGMQYSPAIYYENESEKQTAEEVLRDIEESGVYDKALAVPVLPREKFWPAEEYHQDYYKEHSLKYGFYRKASGRDSFIKKHWGDDASNIPPRKDGKAGEASSVEGNKWADYDKPSQDVLKSQLTTTQYKITQKDGTESAYNNEYWDNKKEGIYVDILSGEPLFSSKQKYESGTGWPSFTKPIDENFIVTKDDYSFFAKRTEVRSRYGDNHLGHVFGDGPKEPLADSEAEPTGLRYCMNSASLRFVPKERMMEEGYGDYLHLFE